MKLKLQNETFNFMVSKFHDININAIMYGGVYFCSNLLNQKYLMQETL